MWINISRKLLLFVYFCVLFRVILPLYFGHWLVTNTNNRFSRPFYEETAKMYTEMEEEILLLTKEIIEQNYFCVIRFYSEINTLSLSQSFIWSVTCHKTILLDGIYIYFFVQSQNRKLFVVKKKRFARTGDRFLVLRVYQDYVDYFRWCFGCSTSFNDYAIIILSLCCRMSYHFMACVTALPNENEEKNLKAQFFFHF